MRQKINVIFKQESLKNHTVKRLKHGTYEWEKAFLSPPLLQLGIPIYVRPYKKPEERICPICKKDVEDEIYFLRANAQKNRANRGHSSKPNLPSF